jgi:hypothetical protein
MVTFPHIVAFIIREDVGFGKAKRLFLKKNTA